MALQIKFRILHLIWAYKVRERKLHYPSVNVIMEYPSPNLPGYKSPNQMEYPERHLQRPPSRVVGTT